MSLQDWNELNKHNAEQELASAMFRSVLSTSPIIDKYSSWLLAGTSATAVIFVTRVEKILPFLTEFSFKICGTFLAISGLLGLLAKITAIMCQVTYQSDIAIHKTFPPIFDKHEKNENKIEEYAKKQDIKLETDIDTNAVIKEFLKPLPKWKGWLVSRYIDKNKENKQAGYLIPIKLYYWQGSFTLLQTVAFMAFIIFGVFYAQTV